MKKRKLYIIVVSTVTFITLSMPLISEIPNLNDTQLIHVSMFRIDFDTTKKSLFFLRLLIISFVSGVTFLIQYYKIYKPFTTIDLLREKTFNFIFEPQLKKLRGKSIKNLRFNIMKKRTYLKIKNILYVYRLQPLYHSGFRPDHRDKCLSFWIIKTPFYSTVQGVCGLALSEEVPKIGDLIMTEHYNFELAGRKLDLSKGLKFILSIPIFRWSNDNQYSVVGVLNIDTHDKKSASILLSDKDYLNNVIQYFSDCSDYISGWL